MPRTLDESLQRARCLPAVGLAAVLAGALEARRGFAAARLAAARLAAGDLLLLVVLPAAAGWLAAAVTAAAAVAVAATAAAGAAAAAVAASASKLPVRSATARARACIRGQSCISEGDRSQMDILDTLQAIQRDVRGEFWHSRGLRRGSRPHGRLDTCLKPVGGDVIELRGHHLLLIARTGNRVATYSWAIILRVGSDEKNIARVRKADHAFFQSLQPHSRRRVLSGRACTYHFHGKRSGARLYCSDVGAGSCAAGSRACSHGPSGRRRSAPPRPTERPAPECHSRQSGWQSDFAPASSLSARATFYRAPRGVRSRAYLSRR